MGDRSILFVFLDGVGLGPAVPDRNPFATAMPLAGFEAISGTDNWTADSFAAVEQGTLIRRGIDACLGMDGLPQSGTGQATLFTGHNCAAVAGRHYGPYPHSATRETIREYNIFAQAMQDDHRVAFANAYPPIFFEYAGRTDRWPVTTRCCLDAGVPIRRSSDIAKRQAIPADLTGRLLVRRDPNVIPFDEFHAAEILAEIAGQHEVSLFEYFLTDKAGHAMDHARATDVIGSLDRFFGGLARSLDGNESTVVITSDHGNLEDLSTKSHTRNPVPLVVKGWAAPWFRDVTDLTGVTPALISALRASGRL